MKADLHEIELASEPAFRLGLLEVRPATLEVVGQDRREVLEPRVMQVLVLLASRRGEVISRDAMLAACWSGRIVGEDAIQRCIAKLRRLADVMGGFEIETLARVGYRLTEPTVSQNRRRRPMLVAAGTMLLLGGASAALMAQHFRAAASGEPPKVAVMPFKPVGRDPQAAAFAASLSDELVGLVNDSAVTTNAAAAPASGDLRLSGAVYQLAGRIRVTAKLDHAPSQTTVWAEDFEQPADRAAALRDEVAGAAAQAIFSGAEALRLGSRQVDPKVLELYIHGQLALQNPRQEHEGVPLRDFEEVTARAPKFAAGHAVLALCLVNASPVLEPPAAAAFERRARAEAALAIRLNPAQAGPGYDALFWLERSRKPSNWLGAEAIVLEGVARAPTFPFIAMRECRLLTMVGRPRAGLPYCQMAIALRPLAPPIDYSYAHVLHALGRADLARAELARTAAFHPDYFNSRRLRFEIEAFGDRPEAAREILKDPERVPQTFSPQCKSALDTMLLARRTRSASDIDRAMSALETAAHDGQCDPRYVVLGAASLGRVDRAFAALDDPGFVFDLENGDLFEPAAAPLRNDPRFWRVASRLGLLHYWRTRKAWPDFCTDSTAGLDCETRARNAGV
jgi:DNA-binding winged helix-turn-helix (wHTH) protein/TolB-like protein